VYHYPECWSEEKVLETQNGVETGVESKIKMEKILDLDPNSLAYMLCSSKISCSHKPLVLTIDNILFLSQHNVISESKTKLTHFSIVFAFKEKLSEKMIEEYLNILSIYVKILLREQKRSNFVSKDLEECLKYREKIPNWKDYLVVVHKRVELLRELKQLADAIIQETAVQLKINNWIEFDIKIPSNEEEILKNIQPYDACVSLKDIPKLKFPTDGIDQVEQIRFLNFQY
jgi:hypothetical protein